jgi:hypothetical protein
LFTFLISLAFYIHRPSHPMFEYSNIFQEDYISWSCLLRSFLQPLRCIYSPHTLFSGTLSLFVKVQ